ncbi:MAG TPA: hypothetical protein VEQ11_07025 [Chloroflexota bacterium]|nr:hypothetical protein [Chloroflexota bacterium]
MTETIWQLIALGATALSFAMILLLALTYRRPRPVSRLLAGAYLIGVPSAAGLYLVLAGTSLELLPALAGAAVGGALGWWQAGAIHVYRRDGRLFSQNAPWYIVAWGISYAATQVAAVLLPGTLPAGAAAVSLVLTSASLWTANARLWTGMDNLTP